MNRSRSSRKDFSVNDAFWHWLIKAFVMPALLATPARGTSSASLPPSRLDRAARERLVELLGVSGLREDDIERIRCSGAASLPDVLRRRLGEVPSAPDGVLYPRTAADVVGLLAICAEFDIAVAPVTSHCGITLPRDGHKALLALDLDGLGHIQSQDAVSGQIEVESGVSGAELQQQLGERGLALNKTFEGSLGGWIAASRTMPEPVKAVTVATPRGAFQLESGLMHVLAGSRATLGVITSAKLRVYPAPEAEDYRAFMFRDFASGLAVLRQAARAGIPYGRICLADDGATRFERALHRRGWDIRQRLCDAWMALRDFDSGTARLVIGFPGNRRQRKAARKNFGMLAKKVGALAAGPTRFPNPYPRQGLLDHAVGMDRIELSASWSELPLHYARARAALKQAMRAHPPVTGAHGLVLAHVSDVRSDGASLCLTWLFPRQLEDEIAQAVAIRNAALAVIPAKAPQGLEKEMRAMIKRILDPKNILGSGA
jgi:alkyldihydroxyacetonephosphate synthase